MPNESVRLRAQDYRAVYLLVGECCELGADPLIWRRHMLQRLNDLFGAVASVDIEAVFDSNSEQNPRVEAAITFDHYSAKERELLTRCLREMKMEDNALGIALANQSRQRGIVAGTRRDWVLDRDWRRCGFVTDYFGPLGWGESMMGFVPVSQGIRNFNFVRERGEPCFLSRHAKMLELLIREIAAIPATRLAPMSGVSLMQLPTRLREVLARIFHGDNEKQIALALGISRSTVHEYIRRLYSRFGVSGRGPLIGRVARHLHAQKLADNLRENDFWFFQQEPRGSRVG